MTPQPWLLPKIKIINTKLSFKSQICQNIPNYKELLRLRLEIARAPLRATLRLSNSANVCNAYCIMSRRVSVTDGQRASKQIASQFSTKLQPNGPQNRSGPY
jgi:hypothetical protein